ncbi:MAG: hypothetical protein Q8880_01970, partial [Bacteroidota bacterium]|nr:hypothetical protein [Bacteroidota bacterium]
MKLKTVFLFVILISYGYVYSQNGNGKNRGIQFSFINTSTKQGIEEVASNVLKIVNNTDNAQNLISELSIPFGWNALGKTERTFRLEAGDSAFFPVRILPDKQSKGSTNYVVNAFLTTESNVIVGSSIWYINVNSVSLWTADLPLNKVIFKNNNNIAPFSLRLQNKGNSDENVNITINSERALLLCDSSGKETGSYNKNIFLPIGTDTTIILYAKIFKKNSIIVGEQYYTDKNTVTEEEKYILKVFVQDLTRPKSKYWSGSISFIKLKHEYRLNSFGYSYMPFTFELNTYGILSENTYQSVEIYGTTDLEKDRFLEYRLNSYFTSNYIKAKTFLGTQHYLGYITPKWSIEVGSSLSPDVSGSIIYGPGIKGTYRYKNHTFGILLMNQPFFNLNNPNLYGISFFHTYVTSKFQISSFVTRVTNDLNKTTTDLLYSTASMKISRTQYIGFGGGLSNLNNYLLPNNNYTLGYRLNMNYRGFYKKLNYGINGFYISKNYVLGMGSRSIVAYSNYKFNNKYSLYGNFSHYNYDRVSILNTYQQTQQNIKLGVNINTIGSNINLYTLYSKSLTYILNTEGKYLGFDYRPQQMNILRFSANIISGYIKAWGCYNLDPTIQMKDIPNFFVTEVRVNLHYKSLLTSIRYNYGPYQSMDQYNFVIDRNNPQSIFILSNYNYWFNQNKMLLQLSGNYRYMIIDKRNQANLRAELFYYTRSGFRFSFYGLYNYFSYNRQFDLSNISIPLENANVSTSTSMYEIGLGLKKEIRIPLSLKKYHDIEIIIFKDLNGNNIKESNESGVENMVVTIKNISPANIKSDSDIYQEPKVYQLITGPDGKAKFLNIPTGQYSIKAAPLSDNNGWYDGREVIRNIDKNNTIFIPLNRGVKLTGGIILQRDKFSEKGNINVSRIRINATDSTGKSFNTLTDNSGNFEMYLPKGVYTISVNEAALGDRFQYLQNNINIKLANNIETYSIMFYIVEKGRNLNIKKFDSAGKLKEQKETNTQNIGNDKNSLNQQSIQNQDLNKTDNKKLTEIKPTNNVTNENLKTAEKPVTKRNEITSEKSDSNVVSKKPQTIGVPEIINIPDKGEVNENDINDLKKYIKDELTKKRKKNNQQKVSKINHITDNKKIGNYGIQLRSSKKPLQSKFFTDSLHTRFNQEILE